MASRRHFLLGLGAAVVAAGRAEAGPSDLHVVAHRRVPVPSLNDVELEAIFLTLRRYWDGSKIIIPFNLPPRSELRIQFDQAVLRMGPDEVGRYWLDRRVRGGAPPPRQAPDPVTLVRLVARLEGAIGYVPSDVPLDDVRVLLRVHNGKVTRP
jgi:hypothetical protein